MEGTERRVPDEEDSSFPERYGIMVVRGCMVLHVRDEDGRILSDPTAGRPSSESSSTKRILRVALDPAQYAMDARSKYGTKIYDVSHESGSIDLCFTPVAYLGFILTRSAEFEPCHATPRP